MLKIFIEEFLEEMATIYKSKEYSILIAVTPDSGRAGNPYFKFLNNQHSKKYKEYTNWQAAKFDWNCEYLEEMLDIDEYFKGTYDEEYDTDPGYIRSDLEMPNYMNLQF